MIGMRSTVKLFDRFPQITQRVEQAAQHGVEAAARTAAEVAQAGASLDLELEVTPAVGDVEGYSAGIKSRKKTRTPGRTTPIARFFDEGTLGKRPKPTKRPRRRSWSVAASSRASSHTAERGDVDGKGIAPQGFFGKARRAGRKALLETIDRELP